MLFFSVKVGAGGIGSGALRMASQLAPLGPLPVLSVSLTGGIGWSGCQLICMDSPSLGVVSK